MTLEDIDVAERLNRQRLLVELNSSLFPDNIRLYKADIDMLFQKNKQLNYPMRAQKILENTPYAGVFVKKADPMVLQDLEDKGLLFSKSDKYKTLFQTERLLSLILPIRETASRICSADSMLPTPHQTSI